MDDLGSAIWRLFSRFIAPEAGGAKKTAPPPAGTGFEAPAE